MSAEMRRLLIVEDDKSFLQRLARAMEARGFEVRTAESVGEGLQQVEASAPAFAVVDMRLGDGNGLDVVSALKQRRPEARAIVLTGYGNIATAVNAVKMGAVDYLSKPADADDVVARAEAAGATIREPLTTFVSGDRFASVLDPFGVRWSVMTRVEDLSEEESAARIAEWAASQSVS